MLAKALPRIGVVALLWACLACDLERPVGALGKQTAAPGQAANRARLRRLAGAGHGLSEAMHRARYRALAGALLEPTRGP